MQKSILIARSNMRRAKGLTVTIFLLVCTAAMLLNLWLILSTDYKQNFDRYHDKLNAEHVTLAISDNSSDMKADLKAELDSDSRISEYCLDDIAFAYIKFDYLNGSIGQFSAFLNANTAVSKTVGRVEIIEDSEYKSGVYMPMVYKEKNIDIGRQITITVGSKAMKYTVCGFFNSVMAGSNNCILSEILLTEDKFKELEADTAAMNGTLCSVRAKDKSQCTYIEADLKAAISEKHSELILVSNNYSLVSQSRYISQMICSAVLIAMAFFVLVIVLVTVASNIKGYIQRNMKNLGAFKATGYTSKQLICALLLQFLSVTFTSSAVGLALSYIVFPAVNSMMVSQTGIPYSVSFLPLQALVCAGVLLGATALAVWLSARRIKKIEPIVALRQGVQTHSFKKNHIPLSKTKLPLTFALALKSTFSNARQNATVCVTMFVLTLVVTYSGYMTANVILDTEPFINLIVGETADDMINIYEPFEEETVKKLKSDSRIEKMYFYTTEALSQKGGEELQAVICDDFKQLHNQSVAFEGRFPKYDNETALGALYAREKNIKIGDEITLCTKGREEKYIVTGFTQISNYLGKDCALTRSGYERLGSLSVCSYYADISENTDISKFNAELERNNKEAIYSTVDVASVISSTSKVYIDLVKILVVAILIISVLIIAFVLYLLVRTMLNQKSRDFGVMKAAGYTTSQLVFQTALSFMPAIIISTILGIAFSCAVMNPVMSLVLSSVGIVKCTFPIPLGLIAAQGAGIIITAFLITCLMSLKIKKISPHKILLGE